MATPTRWQCHYVAEENLSRAGVRGEVGYKENTGSLCPGQPGESRRWQILAVYEKTSTENSVAFRKNYFYLSFPKEITSRIKSSVIFKIFDNVPRFRSM